MTMGQASPALSAADLDRIEVDTERPFFETSCLKLGLLSVLTFDFYQIYWSYRNWRRLRDRSGDDVIPVLRALFVPIFFGFLAGRVREKRLFHDLPVNFSVGTLWGAYFLLQLGTRLGDPYWILASLSFLPVLAIQRQINDLHGKLGFAPENRRFDWGSVVVLMVGGLSWLLVLLALFLPEESTFEAAR